MHKNRTAVEEHLDEICFTIRKLLMAVERIDETQREHVASCPACKAGRLPASNGPTDDGCDAR